MKTNVKSERSQAPDIVVCFVDACVLSLDAVSEYVHDPFAGFNHMR